MPSSTHGAPGVAEARAELVGFVECMYDSPAMLDLADQLGLAVLDAALRRPLPKDTRRRRDAIAALLRRQ